MSEVNRAIEAVWRIEQAKLIASLSRVTRDVGLAEELAQDALVAALQSWGERGIPERPGAWLMAVAKRRALDVIRHHAMLQRKQGEIEHETDTVETPDYEAALDDEIGDDLLRL
ncbi:MAG: sigma factor, partial [Pseudomonadota bacterium]